MSLFDPGNYTAGAISHTEETPNVRRNCRHQRTVNGMKGQSQDMLFSLVSAAETSTKAYIEVCDSRDNLKDLADRAKH